MTCCTRRRFSAIAIAVRNVSHRRRWSKLQQWFRLGSPIGAAG